MPRGIPNRKPQAFDDDMPRQIRTAAGASPAPATSGSPSIFALGATIGV